MQSFFNKKIKSESFYNYSNILAVNENDNQINPADYLKAGNNNLTNLSVLYVGDLPNGFTDANLNLQSIRIHSVELLNNLIVEVINQINYISSVIPSAQSEKAKQALTYINSSLNIDLGILQEIYKYLTNTQNIVQSRHIKQFNYCANLDRIIENFDVIQKRLIRFVKSIYIPNILYELQIIMNNLIISRDTINQFKNSCVN